MLSTGTQYTTQRLRRPQLRPLLRSPVDTSNAWVHPVADTFFCVDKSQEDAPITYSTPNSEWDILASYEAGSIIDIDVVFTNYHWVSVRASYRLIDTDGGLAMGALPWGPYSVNSTAGLCLVAHSLQRHY